MVEEFIRKKKQPIYDPDEFENFCIMHGAPTLFANLVAAVCSNRQGDLRHQFNKRIVVSTIYHICFALSQRCNFMQQDNTLFMATNNLNQEAMNTQRSMGTACSARTGHRMIKKAETTYMATVNADIDEATEHGWQIVASIDDYTSIHSNRRPNAAKASTAINMCTIVFSIFREIPAVEWRTATDLHNPHVIEDNYISLITSDDTMILLSATYASSMPSF